MSGSSFGSVSVHLGAGARFGCHTYPEKPGSGPILFIDAGDMSLTVHTRTRGADDADLANARALAEAVAIYLADVERQHAETDDQTDSQSGDQAGNQAADAAA
jgi:hypothetical protein